MRNEKLLSIFELKQAAKEIVGQNYANDETCFVDTFRNGEYKVESPDWAAISDPMSNEELASLYLPVCQAMIERSGNHREGPTVQVLMKCYSTLIKWQRRHLQSPEEILNALAEVRVLVFSKVLAQQGAWWFDVLRHFEILERGICRRMGLNQSVLDSAYNSLEDQIPRK